MSLLTLLIALAGASLLPVSAPLAANGTDTADGGNPALQENAPNFGGATPSDKFIQSFQQQVSQQLQSALTQSTEAQEARLRTYEQQQHELGEQIRALEQSLAKSPSTIPGAQGAFDAGGLSGAVEMELPHVNVRRPGGTAEAGDTAAEATPGLLSSWSALSGMAPLPGGPMVNPGRELPPGPHDESSYAAPTARLRPGDANIAPHGFVEGRLLNGVVTVQGGAERESVVALSDNYQAANGFQVNLSGCLALVQGRPEIATGRIDFKLSRLTCNFPDGASRTWDASGWLVDADGIRGVRATIVDNTARKAAVAAAGGAIAGMGQRISQQQYQINSSSLGLGTNSTFAGDVGRDALGGGASGAANALGQSISDYYNLYAPSLQVGGGTRVTVVLANDLRVPPSGREITQTHTAQP